MLHAGVAYGYDSFFCPETIENLECLHVFPIPQNKYSPINNKPYRTCMQHVKSKNPLANRKKHILENTLELSGNNLRLTYKGIYLSDMIMSDLMIV